MTACVFCGQLVDPGEPSFWLPGKGIAHHGCAQAPTTEPKVVMAVKTGEPFKRLRGDAPIGAGTVPFSLGAKLVELLTSIDHRLEHLEEFVAKVELEGDDEGGEEIPR